MKTINKYKQPETETGRNASSMCLKCSSYDVASFPVYLTELNGNITRAGDVVRCAKCGKIKIYGLANGIGRASGNILKKDFNNWPVLRRNYITSDKWERAVLDASLDSKRMIWIDARKNLRPAEPEGNAAKILQRWKDLLNQKNNEYEIITE